MLVGRGAEGEEVISLVLQLVFPLFREMDWHAPKRAHTKAVKTRESVRWSGVFKKAGDGEPCFKMYFSIL